MINNIKDNIILIDDKFVVKKDSISRLKAEKYFLQKYKDKIKLEELLESNLSEGYNIYKFIDGKEIGNYQDIEDCLTEVYKIIKKYEKVYTYGYGFIYDLKESWIDFLKDEVDRNVIYIKDNRYKIENREIIRYKEYNYIVKESFNSLYEDFKKYGYYTIMDVEEIEMAFDDLQYKMTDEEVKCNKARIRNIKENIK